jgi:chemotaxis family two-component system sensor kinase Cph1
VTDVEYRLPPGELERLAECVLEPIRFPGAVQSHGSMIVARASDLVVERASENMRDIVGAEAVALLGRPLSDLISVKDLSALRDILDPESIATNPTPITIGAQTFDGLAHDAGESIIVELEPRTRDGENEIRAIRASFRRLTGAHTARELWELTAREVRRITGFDHVMVYHFHADEHGEIVGESIAEGMEPYLGLHYPASDIPQQARALYLTKLSRLIVNSHAEPSALLSDANVSISENFDLSSAELRAVSPHHRQFMRNMKQVSTFSLSIVRGDRLVGMITCAHRTERRIGYGVREGLEILANQVALQLGAMHEIERLNRRNEVREVRGRLIAQVAGTTDIAEALLRGAVTLLDLIPGDGATVRLSGRIHSLGDTPSDHQVTLLASAVVHEAASLNFESNALPIDYPEIAELLPGVSGVLTRRLGVDGDFIAWYRGEVTQTVDWLGDISPDNRLTPLSPRNSFSSWTQQVTGTALQWGDLGAEAAELCRDLDSALLNRVQSQLAELALHDPLTGLPNRRLFMDRLEQSLARFRGQEETSVLFIDLDHFKAINDTYGHSAGDEALIHVSNALLSCARAEDTVARLGGDEFVILCERTDKQQAEGIAQRILEALHVRPEADRPWSVSASIGVSTASLHGSASNLLSAADSAMYQAKMGGRDQISAST